MLVVPALPMHSSGGCACAASKQVLTMDTPPLGAKRDYFVYMHTVYHVKYIVLSADLL
jgi:hypothetical protein